MTNAISSVNAVNDYHSQPVSQMKPVQVDKKNTKVVSFS